ncbi:hypothetical protein Tco_1509933 [Tanacetum coccineum]
MILCSTNVKFPRLFLSLAHSGNTLTGSSNDLTKYLLATLASHLYMMIRIWKSCKHNDTTDNELPIPPLQALLSLHQCCIFSNSQCSLLSPMFDSRDLFPPEEISPPKDIETPVESPILISPSSSVGSSSPVRSTTPPPDYPFDKSIFAELDNSLWIINEARPTGKWNHPQGT